MAPSEQLPYVAVEEEDYSENEGSEYEDSNDSQDDPTYDIFEETQSGFSNLSIEKKSKSRIKKEMDLGCVIDLDEVEIVAPVLDKKDEKSFEMVQKMVEAGQLEKLKVDQCKVYLRKNGLRLTGNKDTLVQRIKEHLDIINGGGEKKYPVSSFVLNCKGDACMGDVVMFEQNVYEMFNIASRSASGPPCGSRIVAGRIVKESYGAAKQQHTFTIEVLWSKGEKPLPPLHPLLIKGRNLYRLETLRQRWEDERERQKVLMEKHSRGSLARSNREARIQEKKEMRKNNRHLKVTRKAELKKTESQSNQTKSGLSVDSGKLVQSPTQQFPPLQRENLCPNTCKDNIGLPPNMLKFPQEMHPDKHDGHPRHSRGSLARSDREARIQEKEMHKNNRQSNQIKSGLSVDSGKLVRPPTQQFPPLQRENLCPNTCEENIGFPLNMPKFPQEMHHNKHDGHPRLDSSHKRGGSFANNHCHREPLRSMNKYASRLDSSHIRGGSFANNHCHREPLRSMNKYASRPDSSHIRGGSFANNHRHREPLRSMNKYDSWGYPPLSSSWGHSHKQVCRHYAKGRCHFGYNCNFLHDFR